MKRLLFRLFFICLTALVIGLVYNQIYPNGIKWPMLSPELTSSADHLDITLISADSAFVLWNREEAMFLDIRSREDFALDHIKGAHNIPLEELVRGIVPADLISGKKWIIYDEEGDMRNLQISARFLVSKGIHPAYILFGGFLNWLDRDYPIERGVSV